MFNFSPTFISFLFFSFHCGDLNTILIVCKLAVCLILAQLSFLILFSFHCGDLITILIGGKLAVCLISAQLSSL